MFITGLLAGSVFGGMAGIVMMCLAVTAKREDEQLARLHLTMTIQRKQERCIHFCNSRRKELFCLPDGASLRLVCGTGESQVSLCHYLDEEHMLVDGKKWEMQEFARQMELRGISYAPLAQIAG